MSKTFYNVCFFYWVVGKAHFSGYPVVVFFSAPSASSVVNYTPLKGDLVAAVRATLFACY